MEKKKASLLRSGGLGLMVIVIVAVYAYGTQVTGVDLSELQSERRQESMLRVIRALFRPDILAYDKEELTLAAPIWVPCPEVMPEAQQPAEEGPRLIISPGCAAPGETVRIEGFDLLANAEGPLRFVPGSDPEQTVSLGRDFVTTDAQGHFEADLVIPARESENVQFIRVTVRQNIGLPYLTQSAIDTWHKIVETVFMALLATTIGTVLAVPLSFIAARNLMRPVRSPLSSIALSAIGWVAGIAIAFQISRWIGEMSSTYVDNIALSALSVLAVPPITLYIFRWAIPTEETEPTTPGLRAGRFVAMLGLAILGLYGLYALAGLSIALGPRLEGALGSFAFLGNFLFNAGDILRIFIPVLAALVGGGALSGILGRIGQQATERLPNAAVRVMNVLAAAAAGALILVLIGRAIEWLYQIGRPEITLWGAALAGMGLGAVAALSRPPKDSLSIGMGIYYITRTILNGLRSVEALVMAIVFVIAVGIGPFAGMLALGLHTIVSLAKLYSEQVESISGGPVEAIQATGAGRLQTIVYAVVPQIVPPYIAYTLYRWDINVRMSTIIGFVGGGGIGFLLQQNINLLNYRGASTQMLAIAIVVATLDYVSSVVRERYV
ncbi:MAG: PhnE/PtxC family ABC transporter permease [Anaerolineales bacterium]